ncbi:unnamed protein product, partial [marine sediment metagenome]
DACVECDGDHNHCLNKYGPTGGPVYCYKFTVNDYFVMQKCSDCTPETCPTISSNGPYCDFLDSGKCRYCLLNKHCKDPDKPYCSRNFDGMDCLTEDECVECYHEDHCPDDGELEGYC